VKLQDTMAFKTIEAEYMIAVETCKKALWLRELTETFGFMQDSVQVHYNSQSDIHLAKKHRDHKQTKYINVRYHKISQWL